MSGILFFIFASCEPLSLYFLTRIMFSRLSKEFWLTDTYQHIDQIVVQGDELLLPSGVFHAII